MGGKWEQQCWQYWWLFQTFLWPLSHCDSTDIFLQHSRPVDRNYNGKSNKSNQFSLCVRDIKPFSEHKDQHQTLFNGSPSFLSGASARTHLHEKMLKNLFQCPVEMFEAYPIGRILNRLSCDMYVIDQVSIILKILIVFTSFPFRNFPPVFRDL